MQEVVLHCVLLRYNICRTKKGKLLGSVNILFAEIIALISHESDVYKSFKIFSSMWCHFLWLTHNNSLRLNGVSIWFPQFSFLNISIEIYANLGFNLAKLLIRWFFHWPDSIMLPAICALQRSHAENASLYPGFVWNDPSEYVHI